MHTTMALATRLAKGPTFAMSLIKTLVHKAQQQDLAEHLAQAARAQQLARQTEDHKEGARAFLEKRQPRFTGRERNMKHVAVVRAGGPVATRHIHRSVDG